jgi:hypothetical protein
MRCAGGRGASREAGGPGVWWRHDKRHARGRGLTQRLGAKGTRGAHGEHVAHGRDAGGIKAQWLVEGRRLLPSRREGMRCGGGERCEPGGGRACMVWWRHDTRGMHRARLKAGGQEGTRGAHLEHGVHVRDAGGVKAQRLVEGRRALPSRREGMRCGEGEVRAGRREGLWRGGGTQEACTGKARLKAWGPRASAERTQNMRTMVVTLEVSKLSGWLKADATCRVEGRGHMQCGGERCEPGGGRA